MATFEQNWSSNNISTSIDGIVPINRAVSIRRLQLNGSHASRLSRERVRARVLALLVHARFEFAIQRLLEHAPISDCSNQGGSKICKKSNRDAWKRNVEKLEKFPPSPTICLLSRDLYLLFHGVMRIESEDLSWGRRINLISLIAPPPRWQRHQRPPLLIVHESGHVSRSSIQGQLFFPLVWKIKRYIYIYMCRIDSVMCRL